MVGKRDLNPDFAIERRTETKKMGIFANKKVKGIPLRMHKRFCEEKMPSFLCRIPFSIANSGLSLNIKIGPVTLTFLCSSKKVYTLISKNYFPFLTKEKSDYLINIHSKVVFPNPNSNPKILRSGNTISITRGDFTSISCNNLKLTELYVQPNKYSLDSWLRMYFTLRLLKHNGLLLHSSAVIHKDKSISAFCGVSGSGKSTMTRKLGSTNALIDEIVLIYLKNGQAFASSTPFWGELKRPKSKLHFGNLKRLFFLKHSSKLSLTEMNTSKAIKNLLKCVLFFSKIPHDIKALFKIATELTISTNCGILCFSLSNNKNEILNFLMEGTNEI